MKNAIFFFVIILALALSAPGFADETVPDRNPTALMGETVPPAPVVVPAPLSAVKLTKGERQKLAAAIVGGVKEENKKLLEAKDEKTATAMDSTKAEVNMTRKAVHDSWSATVQGVNHLSSKLDNTGIEFKNYSLILGGGILVVIVLLLILLLRRRNDAPTQTNDAPVQSQTVLQDGPATASVLNGTNEILAAIRTSEENLGKKIDGVSNLIENPQPKDLTGTVKSFRIVYTADTKDGSYLTAYVPKSAPFQSNPTLIPRVRRKDTGKVWESLEDILFLYLPAKADEPFGGELEKEGSAWAKMELNLLVYLQGAGKLKIERV